MVSDHKHEGARRLGQTIPLLLVFSFFLDLLLRPLPLDSLTFRAWEAVSRYRGFVGPFEANQSYKNAKAYGDLSSMANLPELREYHTERFTTDGFGFRISPPNQNFGAILVGDSFAGGSSLSDDETFSSRFARLLGKGVYNAGATSPSLTVVREIAAREKISDGYIFYQHLERSPIPTDQMLAMQARGHRIPMSPGNRHRVYRYLGYARGLLTSPLQVAIRRGLKGLHNDVVFPNIYARAVVRKTLANGRDILFLPADVAAHQLSTERAVAFWKAYSERAETLGLKLIVILVPTKYTVYAPLLSPPELPTSNMPQVAAALNAAGVKTVDLTSTFQRKAAELLPRGEYIYWRDDTHWNPGGVEVAAFETWGIVKNRATP